MVKAKGQQAELFWTLTDAMRKGIGKRKFGHWRI